SLRHDVNDLNWWRATKATVAVRVQGTPCGRTVALFRRDSDRTAPPKSVLPAPRSASRRTPALSPLARLVIRNGHFGLARSCPVAILTLFSGGRKMAYRAICVALLLSCLPIAGCGTVANLADSRPEGDGKSPFGGVRQDVSCIHEAADGEFGFRTHPN